VLASLAARPDAEVLTQRGLRRALLAGWARELGLRAAPEDLRREEAAWLRAFGKPSRGRSELMSECGLDHAELARLLEDAALERLALAHAARMLSDGPSAEEALADEARLRGQWGWTRGAKGSAR
jgi:hypothetical protein